MPQLTVNLSAENSQKLDRFAGTTGKSRDELLNEAVARLDLLAPNSPNDWKSAWRKAAGMWRDRDDLPDFEEIRRSWDRRLNEDESR